MSFLSNRVRTQFLDTCARIETGRLRVITPEGSIHDFGTSGTEAEMKIHDWSVITTMARKGDIGMGETYGAGLWDTPSIEDLVTVGLENMDNFRVFAYPGRLSSIKYILIDRLLRSNSVQGAARNIRSHYDVGNEFYHLWLDPGMTYSSAIYADGDLDLERAQARKFDRILDKLQGDGPMLEIGCGWGGFAERAADRGHDVTGITISPSQKGYADARLDGRAKINLQDYRAIEGTYGSIASIEMIEAVGMRYWPTYFDTLKRSLAEGGRAVIQAITVEDDYFDTYRRGSDYIRHYTFPGGMLLSDAVIEAQAKKAGLKVTDNFAFGQSYAQTCRTWAERFDAQLPKITALGYGPEFVRHWRYYLQICAASFATAQTDVVQVELAHADPA